MYFAVTDHPRQNGALWALLPHRLNRNRNKALTELPSFEEDNKYTAEYEPLRVQDDPPHVRHYPIAISAPRNNTRMQAQLSVFTVFHRITTPIDKIGDGTHVWKYIIPATAKAKIAADLDRMRISKFQLFPELDNIGERLRR
jgi:hypothetical protein